MDTNFVELGALTLQERRALLHNAKPFWPELVDYLRASGFAAQPMRKMFMNHWISIEPEWLLPREQRPRLHLVKGR